MSSPFVTALFNPLNLMILVIAAVAGLTAAWWLFPLGLLFWLMMVIILSRDPAFRLNHASLNRTPLAMRFETAFNAIKRVQLGLYSAVTAFNPNSQPQLQPVLNAVNSLVEEVYNLCQRMSALENYRLVSARNSNPQIDMEQLVEKMNLATNPSVKKEYEGALAAMRTRQDKMTESSARLDRVEAELTSLTNELNTQVGEILQLQSLPNDQLEAKIPEIVKRLEDRTKSIQEI
jgi:hypothetical protein